MPLSGIAKCLLFFLTTAAVFSRAPKRGNPTMPTRTITGRRKGDPQHHVEGLEVKLSHAWPPEGVGGYKNGGRNTGGPIGPPWNMVRQEAG